MTKISNKTGIHKGGKNSWFHMRAWLIVKSSGKFQYKKEKYSEHSQEIIQQVVDMKFDSTNADGATSHLPWILSVGARLSKK